MFKLIVKAKNLSELDTLQVQHFFLEQAEETCRRFFRNLPQFQNVEIRIETIEPLISDFEPALITLKREIGIED